MNKMKVILDTDIGDDIDDAFALSLLLKEKKVDLLGVTTLFRNPYQRAKMASYFMKTFHRLDIPVFPGSELPLKAKIDELIPKEIKAKEKLDERGKYYLPQYLEEMNQGEIEEKDAADFIIDAIHHYPNEIILFAIGPLTNIAKAIQKSPDIVPLIKEIRLMGGDPTSLTTKEWNIFCDPEAASIVFSSGAEIYEVGLNVTMKCRLDKKYRDILESIDSEQFKLLSSMMKKWFAHYEFADPVMHDPLAVASAFIPVLQFEDETIKVGLDGEKRAVTYISPDGKTIHVAKEVDTKLFFSYFLATIFNREE